MTRQQAEQQIWPWVNRVLLGVTAFFIMNFYSDFKAFAGKVERALLTQAELRIQIERNQQDIFKLEAEVTKLQAAQEKYEQMRSEFYRDYGYLFKKKAHEN
ncbi:MAG: hypothetical protein LPK79_07510 [Bacteroidota bacterium]|nr:hypothetical protein [Bacteroidota bacterium]